MRNNGSNVWRVTSRWSRWCHCHGVKVTGIRIALTSMGPVLMWLYLQKPLEKSASFSILIAALIRSSQFTATFSYEVPLVPIPLILSPYVFHKSI